MRPVSSLSEQEGDEAERSVAVATGPEGNARLTAQTGAVLLVLLALEGVTILRVGSLLSAHVYIGLALVPPVLLKLASTGYRFCRYYLGSPAYRARGAPPTGLRLLAPLVIVSTATVLGSGIALLYAGAAWRSRLLLLHKASFAVWFGLMAIHVLAHILETVRLAPRDWRRRRGETVGGGRLRRWAVAAAVVAGLLVGEIALGRVAPWLGWAQVHGAGH